MGEQKGGGRDACESGKRDGHLVVYVAWPVLGGLAIGLVLGMGVAGCGLLWGVPKVGAVAGTAFFIAWPVATVSLFWYAAGGWGGPLRLEEKRQTVIVEEVERPAQEKPAPMVLHGFGPPAPRLIEAELAQEIRPIAPQVSPEIEALYDFVTRVWPTGNVSRDHCMALGFSRATWEKFVGGRRGKLAGSESGRGWLDRAGCVGRNGDGWQIVVGLDEVYGIHPELLAYAGAKAKMVRLTPLNPPSRGEARTGQDGQARTGQGQGQDSCPTRPGEG